MGNDQEVILHHFGANFFSTIFFFWFFDPFLDIRPDAKIQPEGPPTHFGRTLFLTLYTWLEDVQITDLFEHHENEVSMRAVTFVLHYRNDESERTTDELNAETERLAEHVLTTLGSKGVSQRI